MKRMKDLVLINEGEVITSTTHLKKAFNFERNKTYLLLIIDYNDDSSFTTLIRTTNKSEYCGGSFIHTMSSLQYNVYVVFDGEDSRLIFDSDVDDVDNTYVYIYEIV